MQMGQIQTTTRKIAKKVVSSLEKKRNRTIYVGASELGILSEDGEYQVSVMIYLVSVPCSPHKTLLKQLASLFMFLPQIHTQPHTTLIHFTFSVTD